MQASSRRQRIRLWLLACAVCVQAEQPPFVRYPGPENVSLGCAASVAQRGQSICEEPDGHLHVAFQGEFGAEFLLALPVAYAAYRRGKLASTLGCGYVSVLYFFSPSHRDDTECVRRFEGAEFKQFHWRPHQVALPSRRDWWPPPLHSHCRQLGLPQMPTGRIFESGRPVVLVHNKHNTEWGGPPVNYLSVPLLGKLMQLLRGVHVVYIRHTKAEGLEDHGSPEKLFDDYAFFASNASQVLLFRDFEASNPGMPLNELQCRVFAAADHGISVQGGPSILLAQFLDGGDLLVLHKKGSEEKSREYELLFERFDNARVVISHTEEELEHEVTDAVPRWKAIAG